MSIPNELIIAAIVTLTGAIGTLAGAVAFLFKMWKKQFDRQQLKMDEYQANTNKALSSMRKKIEGLLSEKGQLQGENDALKRVIDTHFDRSNDILETLVDRLEPEQPQPPSTF